MEITDQIRQLFIEIEKLKLGVGRIESHIASESGTLTREAKRLGEEIDKVEKALHDIIYHPETGFMVRIDRLMQESMERKKTKQNIIALWIANGALIIKMTFDYITKK